MPEFHKNQVQWAAPEAAKVSFAKPDNSYLTKALNDLSQNAQRIADTERKTLDDALIDDLNEQINLANQDIEDARSVTADFDSLGEKALSRIQGTLSQYDKDTQQRFFKENPHYIDNTQLAVAEKIQAKKREVFETATENKIPLWASQAVMKAKPGDIQGALKARQEVIEKIQANLGNLSSEATIDNFIFKANEMFDNYNLAQLITTGTPESLKAAKEFLKTPEVTTTIDPYRRVQWAEDITAKWKELQKLKDTESTQKMDDLINIGIQMYRTGLTLAGDDYFQKIANTNDDKIEVLPAAWGVKVGDNIIEQYYDIRDLTPEQRVKVADAIKKYRSIAPGYSANEAKYLADVNEAIKNFKLGVDNKSSEQANAALALKQLTNDGLMFDTLTPEKRGEIAGLLSAYNRSGAELLYGRDMFKNTWLLTEGNIGNQTQILGEGMDTTMGLPRLSRVNNVVNFLDAEGETAYNKSEYAAKIAMAVAENRNVSGVEDASKYIVAKSVENRVGGLKNKPGDFSSQYIANAASDLIRYRYNDSESSSVGRLGIYAIVALEAYKKSGLITDSRMDLDEGTYISILDDWVAKAKRQGIYNKRSTAEDLDQIDDMLSPIFGVSGPNNAEKRVITAIKWYASSMQSTELAGSIKTAIKEVEPEDIRIPSNIAEILPYTTNLYATNESNTDTSKIRKNEQTAKQRMSDFE